MFAGPGEVTNDLMWRTADVLQNCVRTITLINCRSGDLSCSCHYTGQILEKYIGRPILELWSVAVLAPNLTKKVHDTTKYTGSVDHIDDRHERNRSLDGNLKVRGAC